MAQSELKLNYAAFDACNRAVIISGCGRSGTTILGKILHSMDRVEYCFEGPMLVSLFAVMPVLPNSEWMLLYETYLYEEFLINTLCGRGLNCNRADDSSIYNVKDAAIVEARLSKSKRKTEASVEARDSVIVYKVPDISPYLKTLKALYPGSRFVLLKRRASDTINSILQKKWFSDDVLRGGLVIWPNRIAHDTLIPYWIPEADIEYWIGGDELHRAAYYYAFMTESYRGLESSTIVDYDRMLQSPEDVIGSLAVKLGLKFGTRTPELLSTIRPTSSPRVEVLNKLEPGMRQRLDALEDIA